jgi:hypothetical protein
MPNVFIEARRKWRLGNISTILLLRSSDHVHAEDPA